MNFLNLLHCGTGKGFLGPSTDDFFQVDEVPVERGELFRFVEVEFEFVKEFADDGFVDFSAFGEEVNINVVRLEDFLN